MIKKNGWLLAMLCLAAICSKAQSPWNTSGNNANGNCFIGTTNPVPLVIKTNGLERLKIDETGKLSLPGLANADTAALLILGDGSIAKATDPGGGGGDCNLLVWDGDGNAAGPNCFIGTTNAQPFKIHTNGIERMRVTQEGNVVVAGVGAKAPFQVFDHLGVTFNRQDLGAADVYRSIGFNIYQVGGTQLHFQQGTAAKIEFGSANGLLQISVAPSKPADQNVSFPPGLQIDKFGRASFNTAISQDYLTVGGALQVHQANNPSNTLRAGHNGTHAFIESSGNPNARLQVNLLSQRGVDFGGEVLVANRVGIGTANFFEGNREYKLAVNGHIRAKAAHIYPAWADYVFEPDYVLMPLEEVNAFIQTNGHLPGMPSSAEVEADGIDVGEIQAKTLEKVEELTLHLIKLEEAQRLLREENAALRKELEAQRTER